MAKLIFVQFQSAKNNNILDIRENLKRLLILSIVLSSNYTYLALLFHRVYHKLYMFPSFLILDQFSTEVSYKK